MRNSILWRTFRYLLVSMCLVILVFSVFVLNYMNQQYREQFTSSQLYMTEKTGESIEELLSNIKQSAYYLCCNEALAKALIGDESMKQVNQRRLSVEDVNQRRQIGEAFIMNTETPAATMIQSAYAMLFVDEQFPFAAKRTYFSMESVSRQRVWSALDVRDEEWFQETMRYDAQIYAFTSPQASGKVMFAHQLRNIYIVDPSYSNDAGIVLYQMPSDALEGILKNDQMSEGTVSVLMFNDQILASTDKMLFPVGGTEEAAFLLSSVPAEDEVASVKLGSASYALSTRKLNSRWRVVVMAPPVNMWQAMTHMFPLLGTFVLMLIVVSLIISVMFSRRMSAPILNLSNAMIRAREAHELPQPIPVAKSNDEIEYLYHSYNDIVDNIHRISEQDKEKNARLRKTELKALQSQINPHFVYNTLDSVACIALMKGENDIATMVGSLINILKYSIGFANMRVRLQEELDYLKQYIQIQELRYHEGFHFVCDIPDQYHNVRVPKLLIQPLVENALFHAENQQDMLEIRVYCEVEGGLFRIHVCDNGSGADAEKLNLRLKTDAAGEEYGIGIVNVNKRIQLMAGEEYGIHYTLLPNGGLDATIILPYEMTD